MSAPAETGCVKDDCCDCFTCQDDPIGHCHGDCTDLARYADGVVCSACAEELMAADDAIFEAKVARGER